MKHLVPITFLAALATVAGGIGLAVTHSSTTAPIALAPLSQDAALPGETNAMPIYQRVTRSVSPATVQQVSAVPDSAELRPVPQQHLAQVISDDSTQDISFAPIEGLRPQDRNESTVNDTVTQMEISAIELTSTKTPEPPQPAPVTSTSSVAELPTPAFTAPPKPKRMSQNPRPGYLIGVYR